MFLSAAVGCSILLLLPNNSNTAAWRELSVLQHSSQSFFNAVNGRQEYHAALEISAEAFAEVERSLKHDVDGVSLINEPLNKPNILLIVLESVAGPFLPSIALQHGVDSDVKMRNLDEFSKRGLSYSRFMTHQVQTMRGTYAMLCGDLPRFSFEMPKLEVAALSGNRLRCLPQVLKDHGYSTNYLQAAPLSYSNKDTALPLIGYDVAQGAEWFGKDLVGAGWGVGDDALFQEALKIVSSLNDKDQPWFLTVLNVGTHHPFDQVPSSFVGSSDQKTRSFEYLDYELGKFINQLSDRRDLSNTLIVITSDEAGGLMGRGTPAVQKLARNLGTMTMVHPSLPSRRIDDVFGQIDFATTIVDLLGITGETQFQGRSAFREYIKPRKIFAFHNYGGTLFELSQNMVVMCTVELSKCEWFEMPGGQLGKLSQTSSKNAIPPTMLAALELSEPRVPDVEFKLMEEDQQFTIEDDGAYVFCCQYMKLAGNRSLLIDLHIEFEPEIDGVALHFDVVSNKNGVFTTHYQKTEQANSAGSFVLRKLLRFTKDIEEVEVRMHVDGASKLVSKKAILQVQSF
ncbi:hypothetical protein GCM10007879_25060 [Maritalea porphyrae]|uniref:Sulfatase N-terminal domain-containing protein n=1 Tax=Maritalea porphyrae TaxID=880732 RepID=A0ABQ5UUA4_9HYPH|nr:hypothetical protein GCM10007879_25060 [Maritalea porphyrae]